MKQLFARTVRRSIDAVILPLWRHKGRLSGIAILVAIALVGGWTVNAASNNKPAERPTGTQTMTLTPALPSPAPNEETPPATDSTPPADNVPQNTNVSVNAGTNGATVTVNGDTQSVPPNQTFDRTYSSSDSTGSSSVTVHTSTTTNTESSGSSSSQQLNISLHSSNETNAGGKEVTP